MITAACRNVCTGCLEQRSADNLFFSVSASQLGKGLDEQLARFVAEHTDTKLIIIDTLQKVREVGGDNYSYANDYQIMARLKSFADAHGLCILLVHHTRKQTADDKFDMISGTSGLLGAADGAFLLQKEKRTGNAATLEVSGRDQRVPKAISYPQYRNVIVGTAKGRNSTVEGTARAFTG